MSIIPNKPSLDEDLLIHYGVTGMKWGVRRNKSTGVRPIAETLDKSKFGQLSKANVDRHNARVTAKKTKATAKAGRPGLATRHASAITARQIALHKNALAGKGFIGLQAKADKYTWGGNGRFEAYHNKKISQLERSQERISSGKLVVRTILGGPVYSKK